MALKCGCGGYYHCVYNDGEDFEFECDKCFRVIN